MPTVLLDGQEFTPESTPTSWGALLALVDRQIEPQGHIVTDVRFDGIDEAAFREPAALDQLLSALATVEVLTGTPASLLERCLGEALASVGTLCSAATAVGEHFRSHDIDQANEGLAALGEGMGTLIAIAGAASLAVKVDGASAGRFEPMNALVNGLSGHLDALIGAQQSQDWISVADILQYDIEPALRQWEPLLGAIGNPALA